MPSSGVKLTVEDGAGGTETSVLNHHTPRNSPEDGIIPTDNVILPLERNIPCMCHGSSFGLIICTRDAVLI